METTFDKKCVILADLWLNYKDEEDFVEFVKYADLGLPLAFAIATEIIETTPKATGYIDETFTLLLSGLGVEDTGFDSLDDILLFDESE